MSKDLKKKLKAADRRRQSRSAPVAPAPSKPTQVDAVGVVSDTIVSFASEHAETTDAIILSVIRNILNGRDSSSELTAALKRSLDTAATTAGIATRAYRDALTKLQDLGKSHHTPDDRAAFVRYLSVLSE
jgi:hypothetical protein